MKILIGYERSGILRTEFEKYGHEVWSCDLQKSELPGNHIQGDISEALKQHWHLAIFHPPCKYIAWSGQRWCVNNPIRVSMQKLAIEKIKKLYLLNINHIAIENSYSPTLARAWRKPNQTLHPYHFGEPYKKSICLWLKNLPPIIPTNILPIGHRYPKSYMMPGSKHQAAKREITYKGFASAVAQQWSQFLDFYYMQR